MGETEQVEFQKKPKNNLSNNEFRVLHSLIKQPNAMDQELHTQIGIKKSTFSINKARLLERGYFKRYYIPNFPKIGFEMLTIMYGQLNRYTTHAERMRIAKDLITSFAEDFRIISESNNAIHLSISQNMTEYFKNQEKFFQLYAKNNFLSKEGMFSIAYPFEITNIHCFMDYEALIARICDIPSESYANRPTITTGKTKAVKLTRAEKKVLVGMIQFPEESDTFIAEKIDVSRNTVASARRKFIYESICFERVVPNLDKLNLKILNFSYFKFNPSITVIQRQKTSDLVRNLLSPHFFVSKNLDGFLISAHISLEEFLTSNDELMTYYREHDIIKESTSFQISIPAMATIKEFEFLPMTLKVLGIDY